MSPPLSSVKKIWVNLWSKNPLLNSVAAPFSPHGLMSTFILLTLTGPEKPNLTRTKTDKLPT